MTRQLLKDIEAFVRRFIVFASDAQVTAVALWLLHTHAIEAAEVTPYLNICSAEKRSGKSRLLELLAALAAGAVHVANISEAALFRMLGTAPTLLVDEVDALFASNGERTEALRGIINAGNRRGVNVVRCVGAKHTPAEFEVFSPKVLAGIDTGKLPDTIADRSITLRMKRKVTGEPVERLLWAKVKPEAAALRDRISEWAGAHIDVLAVAEPDLPIQLDDRAAEAWWSLLAVADLAGGEWPERARNAAKALHAAGAEDESLGVRLLTDVRSVFDGHIAMHTKTLLAALNKLEESSWGGWNEGKGLLARDLAKRLKPFGVKSKKVKVEGDSLQGYHRDDLGDAWARYLPSDPPEPPEPPEPSNVHGGSEVPLSDEVPEPENQAEPEIARSNGKVPRVPEVPEPVPHARTVADLTDGELLKHFPGVLLEHPDPGPWRTCDPDAPMAAGKFNGVPWTPNGAQSHSTGRPSCATTRAAPSSSTPGRRARRGRTRTAARR